LEEPGGQLNKDLHYAIDSQIWFQLLTIGDPERIPFPMACIREYSHTKTATGNRKRFMRLAVEHSGLQLTLGVLAELMRLVHS
jgi:hypothetical protein